MQLAIVRIVNKITIIYISFYYHVRFYCFTCSLDMLESQQSKEHNQSMPRWCMIAGVSCTLDELLTHMQVTVAINAAKLQLCVLKQNSRSRLCTQMT